MKWIFLLRAFFPSWKFFESVGPDFKLQVRLGNNKEQLGSWQDSLPPIKRTFKSILLNSKGNYLHACNNSLQHLAMDISEKDNLNNSNIESLASFQITDNLVRFQLNNLNFINKNNYYQFRVSAHYAPHLNKISDDILISPVYEVN